MKKILLLFCIILELILFPCCAKKPEVFQGVVTFISGSLKINNKDAVVGSRVQKNDILATADNSLTVVQITQTAVITLRSNTELKFDNLTNNTEQAQVVTLSLNKGSTYHKVIRKGTDYSIKTPTAVASVRGTSFEVNYDGAKTRVSLLNGFVRVVKIVDNLTDTKTTSNLSQNDEVKEVELIAGQSIESPSEITGQPVVLDKSEIDKLTQLDTIAVIPDVEKAIPIKDNTERQKNQTSVMPEMEVIPEIIKMSLLQQGLNDLKTINDLTANGKPKDKKTIYIEKLEEIKVQNNGKLDKITLRSGEIIMGMIQERGMIYKVLTPDGTIEIQPGSIESQTITH